MLIIGESLQRGHMSLYGYGKDTTPLLNDLQRRGLLIKFSDTVSCYGAINPALMRILNFSDYESERERPWFESLSIIDMFALSGFRTMRISNQEAFGKFALSAKSAADRAEKSIFLSTSDQLDSMRVAHDGALLPIIKEAKKSQRERNFYVVHLMGNHMDYKKRYLEEFDKFKSDDIALPFTQKQKVALACYYNSVLYNDYVVNEIYRIFADEDSLIVYLSDHGENIYEQNGLIGHNINTRFTYEIPLLFIASKSFIADHAELWQRIGAAKDEPFMSDDLAHVLADILGIEPLQFNVRKSPLRDEFDASRRRMTNGVDYDENLKGRGGYGR